MTDYDADILWDDFVLWDGDVEDIGSQENPFFFGMPTQMRVAKPRKSEAFKYSYLEGHLRLTFPGGKTYAYRVSEELYRSFLEADSKGRYFHDHIRHMGGRPV